MINNVGQFVNIGKGSLSKRGRIVFMAGIDLNFLSAE
jgi:hypothetical protein